MAKPVSVFSVLAASLAGWCGLVSADNVPVTLNLGECGQVLATKPFLDYRKRLATPYAQRSYEDNWRAHTEPAIRALNKGEVSQAVIADLNFTLNNWPNHPAALQAVANYERRGGKRYEFYSGDCYFIRGRGMVPTDATIVVLHGLYHYRVKKDPKKAVATLEEALAMDSSLIDAHYNIGLIYADMGKHDLALQHAHAAYAAGYPLDGLRKKLIGAGVWTEPPKEPPAAAQPEAAQPEAAPPEAAAPAIAPSAVAPPAQ